MQTSYEKIRVPEDGAWEPMMLVVALVTAAWMGYAFYGDRINPPETRSIQNKSQVLSTNGWLRVAAEVSPKR